MATRDPWVQAAQSLKTIVSYGGNNFRSQEEPLADMLRADTDRARVEHRVGEIFANISWFYLEKMPTLREAIKEVARDKYNEAMFDPLLNPVLGDNSNTAQWAASELAGILQSEPAEQAIKDVRTILKSGKMNRVAQHPDLMKAVCKIVPDEAAVALFNANSGHVALALSERRSPDAYGDRFVQALKLVPANRAEEIAGRLFEPYESSSGAKAQLNPVRVAEKMSFARALLDAAPKTYAKHLLSFHVKGLKDSTPYLTSEDHRNSILHLNRLIPDEMAKMAKDYPANSGLAELLAQGQNVRRGPDRPPSPQMRDITPPRAATRA